MNCKHCFRGEPQNVDISEDIIDQTLSQIDTVVNLTITGGEPSLNPKAIEWIINGITKYNIELLDFGVITNGKIYSQEFVDNLNRLSQCCILKSGGYLRVSQDQFHEDIDPENINLYKKHCRFKCVAPKVFYKNIYDEGNAHLNGIGNVSNYDDNITVVLYDNHFIFPKDYELYINALGDVLFKGQYSYFTQEHRKIGNVLDKPILELLENSNKVKFLDMKGVN